MKVLFLTNDVKRQNFQEYLLFAHVSCITSNFDKYVYTFVCTDLYFCPLQDD